MANRKHAHTRADAQRIHTQTQINRRLYRAQQLANCLYFESISDNSIMVELCISSVLSYLADDLRDVHDLFNGKKRNT
ncbi:derepression protein [Salmonella enterica]|uniref:derepression protein n=1 Tax=Salmonella enterica TaxID=28901 RepID=UPI001E5E0033|nr:derepression protein [Salmonella enterica]EDL5587812.1 derepression protein [Salmonella enterica]MDJ3784075.1 derepression protein [Salmonella enterica]MDJ5402899.1 derepression protein [Salmonella enterica]